MSYHIMIIDEDETAADLVKESLSMRGMYTTVLENASDATKRILEEKPDLVIVDMLLQTGDASDICKNVRKLSTTPIILQTTRAAAVEGLMPIDIGANDYVVKPCDPNEVAQKVEAVLHSVLENNEDTLRGRLSQLLGMDDKIKHLAV